MKLMQLAYVLVMFLLRMDTIIGICSCVFELCNELISFLISLLFVLIFKCFFVFCVFCSQSSLIWFVLLVNLLLNVILINQSCAFMSPKLVYLFGL